MMNSITKKLVSCALCIALGVLLPMAFHVIPNAGSIFLPMHIPVLICGLFCGWPYGLACGIITPFTQYISMKNEMTKLYMSLIIAMLAGRIMNGFVNTCILSTQGYTLSVFMMASFITCLPGIILQLIVIPVLVRILNKRIPA